MQADGHYNKILPRTKLIIVERCQHHVGGVEGVYIVWWHGTLLLTDIIGGRDISLKSKAEGRRYMCSLQFYMSMYTY